MRAKARNFSIDDIPEIAIRCHDNKIKAYLAINTIVYDYEVEEIEKIIREASRSKIDAIICWDLAVLAIAKKNNMSVHISTQASVANSLAIKEYEKLGVSRVILARECSLEQIRNMKTGLEIESFIHGAMCVAVSGRCFMSQYLYGKSANRGECIQPCRRKYKVKDPETGEELELDNHYVMSPKDLCTIDIIDKLIESNISSFKIEGRNRSPEYVKTTVKVYREAVEAHKNGLLTPKLKHKLKEELRTVYNRDFSSGFYLSTPINQWSDSYGSKATKVKEYIGKVTNYYKKPEVAEIKIETSGLNVGDEILIQGPTTGSMEIKVDSIQLNDSPVKKAYKGQVIGLPAGLTRKNDKVYTFRYRPD